MEDESIGEEGHALGLREYHYRLVAVVRLRDDKIKRDRGRTYWSDRSEVEPAEIEKFWQKESYEVNGQEWTIADPASYACSITSTVLGSPILVPDPLLPQSNTMSANGCIVIVNRLNPRFCLLPLHDRVIINRVLPPSFKS